MNYKILQKKLKSKASRYRADVSQRFFKTGPGEYGEGDIFIGVSMPDLRIIAKEFLTTPQDELAILVKSPVHEERMLALVILSQQYTKAQKYNLTSDMVSCYNFYIQNRKYINNWDLVDVTAPAVVGGHLYKRDRAILKKFACSKNLWERRIAIVSTHYFIRQKDFSTTLNLAQVLLYDEHDLIHKAVGWMLREVGKRDKLQLLEFLNSYAEQMPRTMLRYAIEKLSPSQRNKYLVRRPKLS